MTAIVFFYFAFLLSTIMVPINIYLGRKAGIVDKPDPRRVHQGTIPRTGGVAIALAVFIPLLVADFQSSLVLGYVAGAFCIVIFGLIDDFRDLKYQYKFLGQILASLIFVSISGLSVTTLGEIWPGQNVSTGAMAIPITVLFLLSVINVINLSDGLDGLAGGLTLGGLIGFLRHNIHPASVFMGDTGSQFLGFSLGVILLAVTQSGSIYSPVLPLFIIGTPILDTFLVMYERISRGLSPFLPDKRHLHHKLLQFGFTHEQSVEVIFVFHFLLILAGWNMRFGPDYIVLFSYLSLFGVFLCIRILSVEKRQWVKEYIGIIATALLSLKAKSRFTWTRHHVSRFCWRSFFFFFSLSYILLLFYDFNVHPWIGWGSLLLGLIVFILAYWPSRFPSNAMRIIFYFITLYIVIIKGASPINMPLLGHEVELSNLVFYLITVFYFMFLLLSPEDNPLNSINYLFIALAVFVALIPAQEGGVKLMQHIVSLSIFYGLYINLIFYRIQRNIPYVLILIGFSLLTVFVKFLIG